MFCTERCEVSEREGLSVYSCPAVDGSKVEYNPRSVLTLSLSLTLPHSRWSTSGRPVSGDLDEDDRYMWDYCTPAKQENIETDDGSLPTMKPVTLPEREDGGGYIERTPSPSY